MEGFNKINCTELIIKDRNIYNIIVRLESKILDLEDQIRKQKEDNIRLEELFRKSVVIMEH